MTEKYEYKYCGYSNCFRPFYKMRGFMPVCAFHYKHPKKWGVDGHTYTGSVFLKEKVEVSVIGGRVEDIKDDELRNILLGPHAKKPEAGG